MSGAPAPSGTTSVETVRIEAAEGPADALVARPQDDAQLPAVLVYTDAYGIRPSVHAYAQRLASHGYLVLVPNIFYRHGAAPVLPDIKRLIMSEDRTALFEKLGPLMADLTPGAVVADARAWLGFLAARPDVRDGPIGTVGYCLGGRLSLRTAGSFPDAVAAAASFHGGNLATAGDDSPHLVAVSAIAELYIGHADNDRSMDPEQMGRLTAALAGAHVRHTAELYPGAAHGWTQPDTPVYDEASAERHWMRMLDLFGRVLTAA
jgi:carboxymethylenebutenolidase